MNETEKTEIVTAYRQGLTADVLQAKVGEDWGPVFTAPPCSPEAMARVGRQFTRGCVQAVRHCRRARLRGPAFSQDVVVVTVLPVRKQTVARLEDGVTLRVVYLEDEALAALDAAFVASVPPLKA